MSRRRTAQILTAALAAVLSTPASAQTIQDNVNIGRSWFPTACEPTIVVQSDPPVAELGQNWKAAAQIGGAPCTIWIRDDWATWPKWQLCSVIVHEIGHLFGLVHSGDPTNIMYAGIAYQYHPELCGRDPSVEPITAKRRKHRRWFTGGAAYRGSR